MSRLGGVNARDIRMLLEGNTDPRMLQVVVGLAERQDHLFKLLEQMAHAMDILADSQLAHGNALGTLKDAHEAAKLAKSMGVRIQSEAADDTPT